MEKNGFTLVELIAIIAVLAAIFLVSFPSFLNMAKDDDEKEYNEMIETICLAGRSYIYSNMSNYGELSQVGSTIDISVEKLVNYESVNGNLINIKTGKEVINDSLKYTVLDDYSLDCKYID